MRKGFLERNTKETKIKVSINLDTEEQPQINVSTGIGFFDHMLTALAFYGGFDLDLKAQGDLAVDGHHTVEDCGIVLGKVLAEALGDKSNICRFGSSLLPMDDALAQVALDISGRPFLNFSAGFRNERIGEFETCLTKEFFRALAFNAGITLHINLLYGENDHHSCEAIFKAVGQSLKMAASPAGGTMSTKGQLG